MPTTTIIQRILPHYRIPFFNNLAVRLAEHNIDLQCIYGQESPGTVPKTIQTDAKWAIFRKNKYIRFFGQELVWQKLSSVDLQSDLIIIEQANRLLSNYPLLTKRKKGRKIAFWGHGRNLQSNDNMGREFLKRSLANKVDWWFAYTEMSKEIVLENGFPENNITTVNNTIDTLSMKSSISAVTKEKVESVYKQFNITDPGRTCLYCGGLHPSKKLDFLLNASELIYKAEPRFSLLVVGDGPESGKMRQASIKHNWLHYAGPHFGESLAPFLKASQLLLMPGPVGLVIIDSFVAKVPIVTTISGFHGPEIAYLRDGLNGVETAFNEKAYSERVIQLLNNKESIQKLKTGCQNSAEAFSIGRMVNNFAAGIQRCISGSTT
jgi:glycosyltransferase involved in cell wall biosynthesis